MKKIIVLLLVLIMAISLAQTGDYKSNTAHTHVLFKAKHLGVAYTFGCFNDFLAINRLSQSTKIKKLSY